ncbi:serine/threonine-protein phosphatase 7 long form homolog [Bidens hawaiensis]|uniref:serine/threonine-protein phosphatase 7 long form homolog n=1 Tax=Bidens hawaiensis TaxID=980011 RepID=UPI00404B76AD
MAVRYSGGPLTNDLLFLSGKHRANYIFQNSEILKDGGLLRVRRGDQKLWDYLHKTGIPEQVMEYIHLAGFAGVIQCDNRRIDNAMISALVERWRPETNTFHMPFGEVDGQVICGNDRTFTENEIKEMFNSLMGITLEDRAINSWGNAVLAFMYRHLSRSTSADTSEIGGSMFLLKLWAWERLPYTSPKLHMQLDYNKPYGARWQESSLSYKDTASHVLPAFRSEFNSLSESSFIWLPYDDVLWRLPEMCLNGQDCWRSKTYLICWDIVEPHFPSRVLR